MTNINTNTTTSTKTADLMARISARIAARKEQDTGSTSMPKADPAEGKKECHYTSLGNIDNVRLMESLPLTGKYNEIPLGSSTAQGIEEEERALAPPVPVCEAQKYNENTIDAGIEPERGLPTNAITPNDYRPLPAPDCTMWMRIELFDNGTGRRGVCRYVVSVLASDNAPEDVDTGSAITNVKRFANMQDTTAFRKSIRAFAPDDLQACEATRQDVIDHNQFRKAEHEPAARIGIFAVRTPTQGTKTYRQHICKLVWEDRLVDTENGIWKLCPIIHLILDGQTLTVPLKPMERSGRKKTASKFVGYHQSTEYCDYKLAQFARQREARKAAWRKQ